MASKGLLGNVAIIVEAFTQPIAYSESGANSLGFVDIHYQPASFDIVANNVSWLGTGSLSLSHY